MIIICEECGKKYRTKGQLKKESVKFRCRSCGHVFTLTRKDLSENRGEAASLDGLRTPEPAEAGSGEIPGGKADGEREEAHVGISGTPSEPSVELPAETAEMAYGKGMGLRTKMLLLFLVVPLLIFAGAGAFYLIQMERFSETMLRDSTEIARTMAENRIRDNARLVAAQCKQFLDYYRALNGSDLPKETFNENAEFRKIAMQRVGLTGYTALHSIGPMIPWVHPNRKIVGKRLLQIVRKPLGDQFVRFARIVKDIEAGKNTENSGYYLWQDADGALREKFMVVTPVKGTPYGIASTVYMDEFLRPIQEMERKALKNIQTVRYIVLAVLGATLLLMAIIVFSYASRLSGRIRNLTNVAERISVGEMDAEIQVETGDEIGTLAEAIRRMQDSIRLSIERLRMRR